MGLENFITDPKTGKKAQVDTPEGEPQALIVSTRELKTFTLSNKFFTNEDYGIDMNQAVSFGAGPEIVYQEDIEWTTVSIVGGDWDFSKGVDGDISPHAGAVMIKAKDVDDGDIAEFQRGSSLDLTDSIAITGWIAYKKWENPSVNHVYLYAWNTGTGSIVGNQINIDDYVNTGTVNTWHKFTISLSDMGIVGQTIDALRIEIREAAGKLETYYDDIQIEKTPAAGSSTIEFNVSPDKETWLHVDTIHVIIADDDYDSTEADATVPKIPYDTFLGVASLSNGMVYQRIKGGKIEWSTVLKQLSDFLQIAGMQIVGQGSLGATKTWITMRADLSYPIILKSEDNDELRITINDDLSNLLDFKGLISGKVRRFT